MSKHTPGPWAYGGREFNDVREADGELVAVALHLRVKKPERSIAEAKANARLIAAAPDLLAVLKAFSDYVHQEQSATDGAVTYSTTAINHWAFLARAAIAKATGDQA